MKRSFLKSLGLTPEQEDSVMETNGIDIENAKEKAQEKFDVLAEKLQTKIEVLQEEAKNKPKLAENKADSKAADEMAAEIEKLKSQKSDAPQNKVDNKADDDDNAERAEDALTKLQKEFDAYKNGIELEKFNKTKTDVLMNTLAEKKANPKLIPLLMKEFDLSKIELEGEKQSIKGFDDMLKPVQEQYSDIFGKVDMKGAGVANPPKGESGKQEPANLLEALNQKYDA